MIKVLIINYLYNLLLNRVIYGRIKHYICIDDIMCDGCMYTLS